MAIAEKDLVIGSMTAALSLQSRTREYHSQINLDRNMRFDPVKKIVNIQ
jgi:hypothetical protein